MLGLGNTVNATNAVAIGNSNTVTGANGVAIGNGASVAGTNAIAMGTGANANFANSAAFGNGATATRANQQVFGTASNTYTMSGVTSAASSAAQVGPTQIVTSDASGNLATSTLAGLGIASSADISAINSQLAGINNRLDDLTNRSNKAYSGVAMALAMTGGYLPDHKNFAVAINYGTFERQNAAALSSYFRLNDHVVLSGGVSYGVEQKQFSGRAGMLFAW